MIKFPVDHFISGIQERKVYYFSSNRIGTSEPHFFICVKRTETDVLIMSCCTSKFETIKKFVETRKLPYETLVWISPSDPENPFDRDTYVNCNNTITHTVEELATMYISDTVSFSGEISGMHYEQILIGLHKSPLIDQETKELIPKPPL